jgi:hypothetical protein
MAEYNRATWPGFERAIRSAMRRRPRFFLGALPGITRFLRRANRYRAVVESGESHLRDEAGIIPESAIAAPTAPRRHLPIVDAAAEGLAP